MSKLPSITVHITHYNPRAKGKRLKMEGGVHDAFGHLVVTTEDALSKGARRTIEHGLFILEAPVDVTISVDHRVIPYHTRVLVPIWYEDGFRNKRVVYVYGRALDTGGNFGAGKRGRRVIRKKGAEPVDVAWGETAKYKPVSGVRQMYIVSLPRGK